MSQLNRFRHASTLPPVLNFHSFRFSHKNSCYTSTNIRQNVLYVVMNPSLSTALMVCFLTPLHVHTQSYPSFKGSDDRPPVAFNPEEMIKIYAQPQFRFPISEILDICCRCKASNITGYRSKHNIKQFNS